MREICKNLLSYLVTFLRLLGVMILLFPFGWIFVLLSMLPEPKYTVHRQRLEKIFYSVKKY